MSINGSEKYLMALSITKIFESDKSKSRLSLVWYHGEESMWISIKYINIM